jgi:hypothetical protein
MREATALARRIELRIEGEPAPVVIGFRRDGAGSIFFGEDPVIQFNARGELRRGFVQGRLIKADRGSLASLTRVRSETEVQLVRHDLSDLETAELLHQVERRISGLQGALQGGRCHAVRWVPREDDVLGEVRAWLASLPTPPRIAASPRV